MLLGPLSAAFGVMANPIPRGCIELPTAYGEHVWGLMKGRPTKYIKRVPKPGGGYRYFYDAGHGGGVHAHEHMVEGAKFAHGEGHFHIVKQDGDKLHVRNTATGEEHAITKQALAQKLAEHHAEGLKAYRDRAAKALAEAKANKASPKQIARLEERVKRAGGSKSGEPKAAAALTPGSIRNVEVGSTLTFKSPQTGDETNVEYRGTSGGLAHVIMNGVGTTVAIGSLSGQTKSIRPEVQSFIDSAKAEIHGMNPMLHVDRNNEEPGTARKKIAQSVKAMADGDGIRLTNDEREAATQAVIDHLRSEQAKKTAPKEAPKPATESKPPTRVDRSYEAQREASAPKAEGKQNPAAGTGDSSNPKDRGVFKLPDGIMGSIEIFDDGLDEDFDEPETIANMKLLQANMKRDKLDVSALTPEDIFRVSQVLSEIGEWEEGNESDKSSAASKQTIKAINKLSGDLANVAAAKRMTTSLPIGSKVILGGVKSHQWEVVGHEPKDGKIRVRRVGSSDTSGPGTLVNATMAERL